MYARRSGVDNLHGSIFEWQNTLWLYLRCLKLYEDRKRTNNTINGIKSFRVANNVSDVGAHDDTIVSVEYEHEGETKTKAIFVQCKHVLHDGIDATDEKKFENILGKAQIMKFYESFVEVFQTVNKKSKNQTNDEVSQEVQNKSQSVFKMTYKILEDKKSESQKKGAKTLQSNETDVRQQTIQKFLGCKFPDCEFFLISNIKFVKRDYLECCPNTHSSQLSKDIFSEAKLKGNEYRVLSEKLKEYVVSDKEEQLRKELKLKKLQQIPDASKKRTQLNEEEEKRISEFCQMFTLILNQDDDFASDVKDSMRNCFSDNKKIEKWDILYSEMLNETQRFFTPSTTSRKIIFVHCKELDGECTTQSKSQDCPDQKLIQDCFAAFTKIYTNIEGEQSENQNTAPQQKQSKNVGKKLNFDMSDCEFWVFSNISTVSVDLKPYKHKQNSTPEQFSDIINDGDEYQLVAEECRKFLECADKKDGLLSEFCDRFRLFFNQDNKFNVQRIDKVLKTCDVEHVFSRCALQGETKPVTPIIKCKHTFFLPLMEEVENLIEIFNALKPQVNLCSFLTEETDMLSKIISLNNLKESSENFLNSYENINMYTKDCVKRISENKTMNFKTRHQRLKSIEIYRSFYVLKEKSDEHLFILLKSEEDLKNWELARDTCKYIKSKKVHVFLENGLHWSKSELANEYFVTIEIDESETQDEHELRNKTLSVIKSTKVSLQGCDVTIEEILSKGMDVLKEDDICDILESKLSIIGYRLSPESSRYISRSFQVRVYNQSTVEKIKQYIPSGCKETYVIFSEQEKNIFDDTWIKCVKTITDAKKTIDVLSKPDKKHDTIADARISTDKLPESDMESNTIADEKNSKVELPESDLKQDTIHLCLYKNEETRFIYSIGEQSKCIETKVETERNLIDNTDNSVDIGRVIILTGVAGMGKTTSMSALAFNYKKNHLSQLVYFIELSKHIKMFQKTKSIENAIQFVAEDILKLEGLEYILFLNACNKTGQVALFFDAFDEISPEADKLLSQLLLALEETKISKIFVSSRPKSVSVLETTLSQQSINFVKFSTEEKENCLMKFWTQELEGNKEVTDKSLLNPVTKIIELLESEEKLPNKLIAIPLQIIMVARVYYKTMLAFLKNEKRIDDFKLDLINLYEKYINSHVEHFLTDKWSVGPDKYEERHIREKLIGPSELAYTIVGIKEIRQDQKDAIAALYHDFGLLVNEDPPIFTHRTIADYLAAQYIVSYMFSKEYNKATANDIKKILMEDKYEVVRIFINSLLNVGNFPLYFNKIDENEKLVTYADGLDNPIHVAATEGNCKLLEALLNKDKSLINHKNADGETALSCACRSDNADIGRFLIKHNCSVDTVDKKGNNVLHCASYNGNLEILKLVLNSSTNASTADLETFTLSDNQKLLLLLNHQNYNDCPPLHCAIHRGKLNVVEFLINLRKCKLDYIDCYHGSALQNAAYFNYIEIMEALLQSNLTLLDTQNKQKETALHVACSRGNVDAVELLFKFKCNRDIKESLGRTALHSVCLSKKRCTEIINHLLKHDLKLLNIQDTYGHTALHLACYYGNVGAVTTLLNYKCTTDIKDSKKGTALHSASKSKGNSTEIINLLLKHDPELLDKQNLSRHTALHFACDVGNVGAVTTLLNYKCTTDIKDSKGGTALHSASKSKENATKIINLLLKHDPELLNKQNSSQHTALHFACDVGNVGAVTTLLEYECKLNIRDDKGGTALHSASKSKENTTKIINLLLKHDPKLLNIQDTCGHTALHLACNFGNVGAVTTLLNYKCTTDIKDSKGGTVLHSAVKSKVDSTKIINLLLKHDPKLLNKQNSSRHTALHLACQAGNVGAVRTLLDDSDCKTYMRDSKGGTALHGACNSKIEVVEIIMLLVKHDPELLNKQNSDGHTALILACYHGNVSAVETLLDYKCKTDEKNYLGRTALSNACKSKQNSTEIMKLLIKSDQELLYLQDLSGETDLHLACRYGNVDAVELLLNYKCKPDIRDDKEGTALHAASKSKRNSTQIIQLLVKHDPKLLNLQDNSGDTALHLACFHGNVGAVTALLETVCIVLIQNKSSDTVLHVAARNGSIEIINLLVPKDKSMLCKKNQSEDTPLQEACNYNKADAVQCLLNHTESINQNQEIKTAFCTAVKKGSDKVIELLAERYPFVIHEKFDHGRTALHEICYSADIINNSGIDSIDFLIKNGCSVNTPDDNGDTPFHIVVKLNQPDINSLTFMGYDRNSIIVESKKQISAMKKLLEHDQSLLNLPNSNGQTALHLACACLDIDVIKFLLDSNCLTDVRDSTGKTPLQCDSVPSRSLFCEIVHLFNGK